MKATPPLLQRVIPAFYQLGIWRVQYLQSVCCVCHSHPAISQKLPKEGLIIKRSFFSSLVCQSCHESIDWRPERLQFLINRDSVNGSIEQQSASRNLDIQPAAPHLSYIRSAIIAFKYKERVDALAVLVHALQQLPRPHGCHANNSVIIAMPTTHNRLRKRGYDPVAILAYYLSKHWQIPLFKGVSRTDDTLSQQGLDRHERQANISNAFSIHTQPAVRRLLLFDDVVTTGATLTALTQTITEAYPETKISAFCLSHGK